MATPTHVHSKRDGEKFAACVELTTVVCATCNMTYAIPTRLYNAAREWCGDRKDGRGWKLCCPVGHTWWYIGEKTEAERLREQLTIERRRSGRLASERDQARASVRGQKAAKTRFRNQLNRLATGQCPWCDQHFSNVREHVKHVHPDHAEMLDNLDHPD